MVVAFKIKRMVISNTLHAKDCLSFFFFSYHIYSSLECLCMCSASCFLFTLAFSTSSFLTFSLSDHLPLLFATISLRSAAIQTFLLYDRIKCPKQLFSDWVSLMTTVLHADCSKVLLTMRHDPSALCCSAMAVQQQPKILLHFLILATWRKVFLYRLFLFLECQYLPESLIRCYGVWSSIIPDKSFPGGFHFFCSEIVKVLIFVPCSWLLIPIALSFTLSIFSQRFCVENFFLPGVDQKSESPSACLIF